MKRELVVPNTPQPMVLPRWVGIAFLLLLLAGVVYLYFPTAGRAIEWACYADVITKRGEAPHAIQNDEPAYF